MSALWPLLDAFPKLAAVPRVELRKAPTPVEQIGERLWIKRDDLTADPIGGNKVRALEFLLAQFPRGSRVITGGSRGSTHVLSTVAYARRSGLAIEAATWPQEMNVVARAVDERLEREANRRLFRSPVTAALWLTWRAWRGDNVIPAGGTSPLGMIGHVNAALELAAQIREGVLPRPERVVVPLGTGGTLAGLLLGFMIAGLETEFVGARVVPFVIAREDRAFRLARRAQHLLKGLGVVPDYPPVEVAVRVDQRVYAGAYGRPLPGAPTNTANGVPLDPTYSAKAYVSAMRNAKDRDTLFWMTFDSRWMHHE